MQKENLKKRLAAIFFALALSILLANQSLGINTLIISIIVSSYLWPSFRSPLITPTQVLLLVGTFWSACMVTWFNSTLSQLIWLFSLTCMVIAIRSKALHSLMYVPHAFYYLLEAIWEDHAHSEKEAEKMGLAAPSLWNHLAPLAIGGILTLVFIALYASSLPGFQGVLHAIFDTTLSLSAAHLKWFVLGLGIAFFLLKQVDGEKLFTKLLFTKKEIIEPKPEGAMGPPLFGYYVLLPLVGLLVLVLVSEFYFSPGISPESAAYELSQFVHYSTYTLIISFLLVILVVLFLFKGSLNFVPQNRFFHVLSNLWIGLNLVLASTVAYRNYLYISGYGLAYKRIGVLVFLAIVAGALIILLLKVNWVRNARFFFTKSSWFAYILLLGISGINWDIYMTKHNIRVAAKGQLDTPFLIQDISDKNIYLLLSQKDQVFEKASTFHQQAFNQQVSEKISRFDKRMKTLGWPSWNVAAWRNMKALKHLEDHEFSPRE